MAKLAPYSTSLFAFSQLLLITALIIKPSPYRWLLWPPIAGIILYLVLHTTSGSPNSDYSIACTIIPYLFTASDYIFLTDVQRALRRTGQHTPAHALPFLPRVKWALDLFFSPRGVGWAHEPTTALPPRPAPASRAAFVRTRLLRACAYFLAFDAACIYNRRTPCFARGGPSMAAGSWAARSVHVLGFGVPAAAMLSLVHCVLSAVAVGSGLSDAENWPYLLGRWRDAYTLRRFWGRTWHQLMRRYLSAHGRFLAHTVLGLAPGTRASSNVQLYTGFLISGVIHYLADYMLLRHWGGGSLRFFVLQAVAITLEDEVVAFAARRGVRGGEAARVLGYVWVWMWFAWSLPGWVDPQFAQGLMEDGLNVSVIEGVWRGEWAPRAYAKV